jgi:hypothetical protein
VAQPSSQAFPGPRIRVSPARPGFVHPADGADVGRLLAFFGPTVLYGLRSVEMRHAVPHGRPGLWVAALRQPGQVVLYEQPRPPWWIPGRLNEVSRQRLLRAGAVVREAGGVTHVAWTVDALRDFMLFDGLIHELGHHIIQNDAGNGEASVMRVADHEARADAFAAACRRAWDAAGHG